MTKILFISILASLGAAAVAWGLILESFGEKSEYRDIEDFRTSVRKSHCGQNWVLWGVIAEMILGFGLAIWEGTDMAKTGKQIKDADTRNLPIQSIKGYARIKIRPKEGSETQFTMNLHETWHDSEPEFSDLEMKKGETVLLVFWKSPINEPNSDVAVIGIVAQVVFVGTESGEGIGVRKQMPYVPNICFDLTFNNPNVGNPNGVTFNELKYVQIEGLGRDEVQQPLQVLGGEMTLYAGVWPKTFLIPSQTNRFWRVSSFETNAAFVPAGYGNLTNSPSAK